MARLVRLLAFLAVVVGGPAAVGFLIAPGSWAEEGFESPPIEGAAALAPAEVAMAEPPVVLPETGWWWTPSEPGRGFVIERSGARLMVGALAYEDDGRSAWSIAAGTLRCGSEFDGTLVAYDGGQTLNGRYRKATATRELGRIAIRFSSPSKAELVLPNGRTLALERYRLGGGVPSAFAPEPGWWWNPAEPGRGFAIEVRHGAVLLTGAAFDEAGHPVWYVSYGILSEDRAYRGRWYRLSGGATLDGGNRTPDAADAGPVALRFTDAAGAILTLADGRSVALGRFDPASARGRAALAPVADQAPKDCGPEVKLAQAPG